MVTRPIKAAGLWRNGNREGFHMKHKLGLAAAFAALFFTSAAAQAEEYADYGKAKGWAVQSVSVDGNFMRCEAMKDDVVFMLSYSSEGWVVTVDALPGNPGEAAGSIEIDRASFPTTFYQLSDGRYGAFLDDGAAQALRAGSYVVLEVSGQVTEGPLVGSAAAMGKLEECLGNGGEAQAKASDGTAAPAPQPVESDAARMDATCPNPRDFVSPASDQAAPIEFVNKSDIAISIYWIDFDGQLQEYAGTLPGESVTLESYVGHTWLAKDFNGTCHSSILVVYPSNTRYELF